MHCNGWAHKEERFCGRSNSMYNLYIFILTAYAWWRKLLLHYSLFLLFWFLSCWYQYVVHLEKKHVPENSCSEYDILNDKELGASTFGERRVSTRFKNKLWVKCNKIASSNDPLWIAEMNANSIDGLEVVQQQHLNLLHADSTQPLSLYVYVSLYACLCISS